MQDDRLRVPGEQLFWACSCGGYMSKRPGSLLGVAAHQRKTKCGGANVAVLPEDFVVADEIDVDSDQGWAVDAPGADAQDEPGRPQFDDWAARAGVPPAPELAEEPTPAPRAGTGAVAQGKVVPPADGGPTRFRGPATVPAALYAAYDALRTQAGLDGSIDDWMVECTSLYLELLGFDLRLVQEVA